MDAHQCMSYSSLNQDNLVQAAAQFDGVQSALEVCCYMYTVRQMQLQLAMQTASHLPATISAGAFACPRHERVGRSHCAAPLCHSVQRAYHCRLGGHMKYTELLQAVLACK